MKLLIAAIIVVALLTWWLSTNQESFQHFGLPADVQDGLYRITSMKGLPLTSNIIDTVMCKDFLIGQTQHSKSTDWKLKRVAQGVYIFYKPGEKECMYTHPTNSIRSYYFPSCSSKNMCGLETPDYRGELDSDSLRTYFMILKHPKGKYYIKSMKNNKYVCMTNSELSFESKPNKNCLFSIAPSQ